MESKQPEFEVSPLGFGTWQFGSAGKDDYWGLEFTDELASSLVQAAAKNGVTYFDTAEDYAKGGSEIQLGNALRTLDDETRKSVVIGSKILPNDCGDVRAHCEGTLKRLGVDSIDLYMVHWPIDVNSMAHFAGAHTSSGGRDYATTGDVAEDTVPPSEQAFIDLMKLQKEGKIKHIGVSNFGVKQLTAALSTGVKIAVNQLCYNLLFRAIEFEILPFCVSKGISVLAYSPLMQGLLTGRWTKADDIPTYRARTRHFDGTRPKSRHGEKGHEALLMTTINNLIAIAKEADMPLAKLAIAYPLTVPGIKCVIAGATKLTQLQSNIEAASTKLSPELAGKLAAATDALKQAMGPNADLWQGVHEDGKNDGRIM